MDVSNQLDRNLFRLNLPNYESNENSQIESLDSFDELLEDFSRYWSRGNEDITSLKDNNSPPSYEQVKSNIPEKNILE